MKFMNVIADVTISRRSPVVRQPCVDVLANLSDVGGLAFGAVDRVNRFMSVFRFVLVLD